MLVLVPFCVYKLTEVPFLESGLNYELPSDSNPLFFWGYLILADHMGTHSLFSPSMYASQRPHNKLQDRI